MKSSLSLNTTYEAIPFDTKEIMPQGKIGHMIDWNKVFDYNPTHVYYPPPINRSKGVDEHGNFNYKKFTMSRRNMDKERAVFTKEIEEQLKYLTLLEKKEDLDGMYIWGIAKNIVTAFEKALYLGFSEEQTKLKDQLFYYNLVEIRESMKGDHALPEDNSIEALTAQIRDNTEKGLIREKNEYEKDVTYIMKQENTFRLKFMNEDGSLNVDAVLATVDSYDARNYEGMLSAFYTATCSKEELERLQIGMIEALDGKIKKLDTFKVFLILEWILPYISEGFHINWEPEEILRPEYLEYLYIDGYNVETFTTQAHRVGKEQGWSDEIQEKLIQQFIGHGTAANMKGRSRCPTEQLSHRRSIICYITEKKLPGLLKDKEILESKPPRPNILGVDTTVNTKGEVIKALLL